MIKGLIYDQQLFKSEDFRIAMRRFFGNNDGVLYGCAITINTNNILVGTGYFVIDGGLIQISTQETIDAGASGTKKLCYQIDLSQTNTEIVFNQGSWVLITGDPTQQDLWGGGTIYQLPFCEVTTNGTSISSKTDLIEQIDGDFASLIAGKVNISDIKNNLTSTDTDKPLSAAQGKALQDTKISISDIVDSLTSTDTDKPLSANQGRELAPTILYSNYNGTTGNITLSETSANFVALEFIYGAAAMRDLLGQTASTKFYLSMLKSGRISLIAPGDSSASSHDLVLSGASVTAQDSYVPHVFMVIGHRT